jgi:hypothetical protein
MKFLDPTSTAAPDLTNRRYVTPSKTIHRIKCG